jgi:hypothetical protein
MVEHCYGSGFHPGLVVDANPVDICKDMAYDLGTDLDGSQLIEGGIGGGGARGQALA